MWEYVGDYVAIALAGVAAVLVLGLIGLLALAPLRVHLSLRPIVFGLSAALMVGIGALSFWSRWALLLYAVALPVIALGLWDIFQKKHAALRNFPVLGHFRYLLEMIRPEIRQYFIESDTEEKPFSREKRSLVYQRAKGDMDTLPFGTKENVYEGGYEWITHSIAAVEPPEEEPRVLVGNDQCSQPYSASLFNISAMSYGSLSKTAVLALSRAAKMGGFFHNTGEGGVSPYHLEGGGDLVWQIGTGYFGCRTPDGRFCPDQFRDQAAHPAVKMIELKLSQGAKPGHGGILPAAKVTKEIAAIRGIPMGQDILSPPAHTAFDTPIGLLEFIDQLRRLSGGKPIGFKLCVGHRSEFLSVVKAMLETEIMPDFIAVDGAEGGTGAAPHEFSSSVGMPLNMGLLLAQNGLTGAGLRGSARLIAAGRVVTGFHIVSKIALGADLCNSARGMMFAIGCIQALKCNTNHCPVGVATQNPGLYKALDPTDKAHRAANYHRATVQSVLGLLGAAGMSSPDEIAPSHICRSVTPSSVKSYAELYDFVEEGSLLEEPYPPSLDEIWRRSSPFQFPFSRSRSAS